MRIGIFEIHHFEGAYPLVKLFDTPSNEVVIFTTEACRQRMSDMMKVDADKYRWVILQEGRFSFFRSLRRQLRQESPDLIFFNTINDNHLLYVWAMRSIRKSRVIVTVHNINCLFASKLSLWGRQMIRHFGKQLLIRQVKEFNVVADTMLPYLRIKTGGKKRLHSIPAGVYESDFSPVPFSLPLTLVVPGTIDKKRRDYEMVFSLLAAAESKKLPVQIILAGGAYGEYGRAILEKAHQLQLHHTKLIVYEESLLPQVEFDKSLNEAHFIFIPSVVSTRICGSIPEVYGQTKSSGNVFDVIRHAKPYISPRSLRVADNLAASGFQYKDIGEIVGFLESLIREPELYRTWQEKALSASNAYTIEAVRASQPAFFQQ